MKGTRLFPVLKRIDSLEHIYGERAAKIRRMNGNARPRKGPIGGDRIRANSNLTYHGSSGMVGKQFVARMWKDTYVIASRTCALS
ncbi:MAG: hypothetical protein ACE5QW_02665 [Thermoplasmata archaeon]